MDSRSPNIFTFRKNIKMLITQSDRNHYNMYRDLYTHIISIVCPDEKELVTPIHENHIIMKMWDVDKLLKNKFRSYEPPNGAQCFNILTTVYNWYHNEVVNDEQCNLLIHCDAGINRSPAITLGVLWNLTAHYFLPIEDVLEADLRYYMGIRKGACIAFLNEENTELIRYIEGRFNPGVKPNQAILKHFRGIINGFPW